MSSDVQPVALGLAVMQMVLHPLGLLRDWNWKAALFSALMRSGIFFATNARAGHHAALKAMLVELVYASVAAGLAGAVTQRLRHAVPVRATAAVVWVGIPLAMLALQAAVHRTVGTPRLKTSLIASFVFAAFATGFNWFAMSRGAFVTGEDRSFVRDLLLVPKLIAQFLLSPLRLLRNG